jgi:hypothetical protein
LSAIAAAGPALCYIHALMNRIPNRQSMSLLVVAAVLILRAAIPAGYMPAAAGSGLLFEFCPDGVPAGFMQMLAGHGKHDHGDSGDGHHGGYECSFGHLLLSAAAVDNPPQAQLRPPTPDFTILPAPALAGSARLSYHSRGPPA